MRFVGFYRAFAKIRVIPFCSVSPIAILIGDFGDFMREARQTASPNGLFGIQ
jgi:hypothetical protein